jgi:hypothetical protein
MNSKSFCNPASTASNTKAMTTEQFSLVIEAILAGKYSWACLLILRFAGYNPLHYIPYRTYNRLTKENTPSRKVGLRQPPDPVETPRMSPERARANACNALDRIPDLAYLDVLPPQPAETRGGRRLNAWFCDRLRPERLPVTDLRLLGWG